LHTLNARLVKAKHELHASTLKVSAIRSECDRAQQQVEENDAAIVSMEREEQRLKLAYVEGKLTYEKVRVPPACAGRPLRSGVVSRDLTVHLVCLSERQAHAEKYTLHQELKQLRAQKQVTRCAAASRCSGLLARRDWLWRRRRPLHKRRSHAPQAMVKDRDGTENALATRQTDWTRCQRRHRKLDQSAEALGVKLEVRAGANGLRIARPHTSAHVAGLYWGVSCP
jgi:hypothetical protein